MKGKGWFSTTVILLLFLALSPAVAWGANPPDIDSKIKDEQGRLEAIEKQISFHQKQIQQARRKEQGLLDDLSRIDQSVTLLKQKVALLDLQREKTELGIRELTAEIQSTEADLAKTRGYLARRFEAIYKYGGVAEFNLLLSSSSTHEALTNAYLLARMAREDERRIVTMKESKMKLESSRKQMLDKKALLVKQKESLENDRKALKNSEAQRKQSLDTLTKQKALHQKAARELEEETGYTLNVDKYNWQDHAHFITEDSGDAIDFGEGKKNIFALESATVLRQIDKGVQLAVNTFGQGRGVYISGLPYSFANSRLLYRAILWAASAEGKIHRWFSTNYNVEVHAYVKNGKYCVVNNTYEPQQTTVYRGDGSSFAVDLAANAILWYEI